MALRTSPGALERNPQAGLSLVELLIVLSIISILGAIAVPAFLMQKLTANHMAAATSLRAIVGAQIGYFGNSRRPYFYATLQELIDGGFLPTSFTPTESASDVSWSASEPFNGPASPEVRCDKVVRTGYEIIVCVDKVDHADEALRRKVWFAAAHPLTNKRHGVLCFFVDSSGLIKTARYESSPGDTHEIWIHGSLPATMVDWSTY